MTKKKKRTTREIIYLVRKEIREYKVYRAVAILCRAYGPVYNRWLTIRQTAVDDNTML